MDLSALLPWVEIILAILLVGAILLQQNEAGLGSAFGSGNGGSTFRTKRGLEKTIFNATIILAILFLAAVFLSSYLGT
jgi:preprotein translocase subunit SecG